MTSNDLFKLEKKKSNIEEFFALLYGQEIHPSFLVYSELPIDFLRIESLEVWQIENDNDFYFVLYFFNQPFLIGIHSYWTKVFRLPVMYYFMFNIIWFPGPRPNDNAKCPNCS